MKEIIAYEMSFDKMFEYSNDVSCIPFIRIILKSKIRQMIFFYICKME